MSTKYARKWNTLLMLLLATTLITSLLPLSSAMQAAAAGNEAAIFSYNPSDRYGISTNYTVKANGQEIPVVKGFAEYDYAHFSAGEGQITYEVTILNTDKVHEYSISPKKLGLTGANVKINGRTITFTTEKDQYLIVTINNRSTKLVIAADPAETDTPSPAGTGIFNIIDAPYLVDTSGQNTAVTERTAAIQKAIDDASQYGSSQGSSSQGIVYIPQGTYYIGNLVLKSNSALYLAPGATLVGTGKTVDYTEHWFKDSMGRPATWWISTAFDSSNIKIFGRGTIDGNGKLLHDDKSTNGKGMINNLIVPIATEDFVMDGIIVRESAAWSVVPVRSNDLLFTNLKLFNSLSMGENDGIDIVESQNAIVRNVIGIALDDPFSTKSWKETTDIASGKVPWPGSPEEVDNILFENTISWTWCYGYKIGQGVEQNQRNITFRDAVVYRAAVGFAVHHKYGNGSVDNVTFENIDVEDISGKNEDNSSWMTLFVVKNGANGEVGPISNVTVKNITIRDAGEAFGKIKGMEGAEITDITFENIYMPGSTVPATTLSEMNFQLLEHYGGVTIKPVQNPEPRVGTNLALHQPAFASSLDKPEYPAALAFDGNPSTRFTSLRGVDPGWIYVDLGKEQLINQVRLVWEGAYGKSYQIQVANENPDAEESWTTVYSTTSGKGGTENVAFEATNARYVRMYGTERATQYGYSLYEMEVYGPEVLVDSIELNHTEATIALGESLQLVAKLSPENATYPKVKWSTSNAAVAIVDSNGLIHAMGTGTAVITARTLNDDRNASMKLTVTEPGAGMNLIKFNNNHLSFIGRWDNAAEEQAVSYWPGAYLKTGFTGKKAYLELDKPASIYVKIDDQDYVFYDQAAGIINLTPVGLEEGNHTLMVVAKDVRDSIALKGLYLEDGATTLPLPQKQNRIEFIGDSITVGYRMPNVVLDSYAWLTAEALQADHTQIAYTGICLQTGIQCYAPNALGMSEQFFKLQTGDNTASPDWDFQQRNPNIAVINLGTNDFKFNVTQEEFQQTLTDFLAEIRTHYPETHLMVLRTLGGFMTEPTKAAVEKRQSTGDAKVYFVDTADWVIPYPSADFYDDIHPSQAGHKKIANRLASVLQPYLEPELPEITVPDAPVNIKAVAGNASAVITFTMPHNDGGSDITGYEVISSPDHIVTTGSSSPITITGLRNGISYTFTVKAINSQGRSTTSAPSNAVVPYQYVPQPTYDTAAPQWAKESKLALTDITASSVMLKWPSATDNYGVAGYRIYSNGKLFATASASTSELLAEGLLPETAYQFEIEAYDAAGNSSVRLKGSATTNTTDNSSGENNNGENSQSSPFVDIDGHWAYNYIKEAVDLRIISGYPEDQTFRPDQNVTRAQFIVMLVHALQLEETTDTKLMFTDEGKIGVWARKAIVQATAAGIVTGFTDGSLRPNDTITRVEMATLLTRAFHLAADLDTLSFADRIDIPQWAEQSIAAVAGNSIMIGKPGKLFAPKASATRAEAVATMLRALKTLQANQ